MRLRVAAEGAADARDFVSAGQTDSARAVGKARRPDRSSSRKKASIASGACLWRDVIARALAPLQPVRAFQFGQGLAQGADGRCREAPDAISRFPVAIGPLVADTGPAGDMADQRLGDLQICGQGAGEGFLAIVFAQFDT